METAERIGSLALRAMLDEIAATPKPGLVDRRNCGAHQDMDYFTFMASAAALAPHFRAFAALGLASAGQTTAALFDSLRQQGRAAEAEMFRATQGVNTHKGAIFSLGLICGAAGRLIALGQRLEAEAICGLAAELTAGLSRRDYQRLEHKSELSKGEKMFLQYGVAGVRGEAESGFLSVRQAAYPVLAAYIEEGGRPLNDLLVQVLLCLMAEVCDTNVLARHDEDAARYVQTKARELLQQGGALTPQGLAATARFDDELIARNISPGGCADLLSVTLLLYDLTHQTAD